MNHQLPIDWDTSCALPISGRTAAARHASASGAHASAPRFGARVHVLLRFFRQYGRLTIAQASDVSGLKEASVCSAWRSLERAGLIEGTADFFCYELHGRTVKREFHRLTTYGREVAGRG